MFSELLSACHTLQAFLIIFSNQLCCQENHSYLWITISGELHSSLDHNFRKMTLLSGSGFQENPISLWITIPELDSCLDHNFRKITLLSGSQFQENHTSLWIAISGELDSSLDPNHFPHHALKGRSSRGVSCSSKQLLGQAIPWYSRNLGRFPRDGLEVSRFFPRIRCLFSAQLTQSRASKVQQKPNKC